MSDRIAGVAGVYVIRNQVTDDCYIGSSRDVGRRWAAHRSGMRCGSHPNPRLARAGLKYGVEMFEFRLVECVGTAAELREREQFWLDQLKPAYNLRPRAGDNTGWAPSALTLQRRSRGLRRAWADPRKRVNLLHFTQAGTAALQGVPLGAARRVQVSETTRRAYAQRPEVRAHLVAAMAGKPKLPGHRAALAATAVRRWQSSDYRERFRAARKEDRSAPGERHLSAEVRAQISASKTGKSRPDVAAKNADPAYQERCRQGQARYWARKAAERQAAGLRTNSKYATR